MRLNISLSFCMILTSALMLISSTYHQTTLIMPSDLIRHKPHMLVMDSHHKERERILFYTSLWFAFPCLGVTNPKNSLLKYAAGTYSVFDFNYSALILKHKFKTKKEFPVCYLQLTLLLLIIAPLKCAL